MNQAVKRLRLLLENTFLLKIVTIITLFFLIFPTLKTIVDGLVKIILIWGGVLLLYDVFTKRVFLKTRYVIWLLLFLIMEAVTTVLNVHSGFKNNVSLLGYTAVAMLVLYPNDEKKESLVLLREMRVIGFTLIALCAGASAASLLIYVMNYTGTLVYANTLYYMGVFQGRLWGVYSNPDFPAAMLAVMLSLIQFPLCRAVTKNKKTLPLQYAVILLCLVLNYWYAALAQSRGSLYAFYAFLCVYLFFLLRKKVFSYIANFFLSCTVSAVIAVLAVAAVWGSEPLVIRLSSDIPSLAATSGISESTPSASQSASSTAATKAAVSSDGAQTGSQQELGRDQQRETENVLTNRNLIWKQGIEKFLKNPLFGYGNRGSTKGVTEDSVEVKHFHNVVIQSLVADGVAGTLPLAGFALLLLGAIARYIVRRRRYSFRSVKDPEIMEIIYSCFALIVFYMANNMVEVFIVFTVSLPNFVFWIYLGYMMSLMMRGQPLTRTQRLLRRFSPPETVAPKEKTA